MKVDLNEAPHELKNSGLLFLKKKAVSSSARRPKY